MVLLDYQDLDLQPGAQPASADRADCHALADQPIAVVERAARIWAIAAIHGHADRLTRLHDQLWPRLEPDDRVVYLGNMIGHGPAIRATLDELLDFRRAVIARPGGFACHVVHLRGRQEVMWQKLLQLQFTQDPAGALTWMLQRGVAATLAAYGGDPDEGLRAARGGALALTRWTASLREAMQRQPGHTELLGRLYNAAHSDRADGGVLFVHVGLDPTQPLAQQKDLFWWHGAGFAALEGPYGSFSRVVRGFDPRRAGVEETPYKLSLDTGTDGPLIAAALTPDGELVDRLET